MTSIIDASSFEALDAGEDSRGRGLSWPGEDYKRYYKARQLRPSARKRTDTHRKMAHKPKPQRKYKCELCPAHFVYFGNLKRHIKTKHEEDDPQQWCLVPGCFLFGVGQTRDNLEKHCKAFHDEVEWEICKYKFDLDEGSERRPGHENGGDHSPKGDLTRFSEGGFVDPLELDYHFQTDDLRSDETSEPWHDSTYASIQVNPDVSEDFGPSNSGSDSFVDSWRQQPELARQIDLRAAHRLQPEHVRQNMSPKPPKLDQLFRCDQDSCKQSFRYPADLRRHVKSVHERKRDFVCKVQGCKKRYAATRRDHLHAHYKAVHRLTPEEYPGATHSPRRSASPVNVLPSIEAEQFTSIEQSSGNPDLGPFRALPTFDLDVDFFEPLAVDSTESLYRSHPGGSNKRTAPDRERQSLTNKQQKSSLNRSSVRRTGTEGQPGESVGHGNGNNDSDDEGDGDDPGGSDDESESIRPEHPRNFKCPCPTLTYCHCQPHSPYDGYKIAPFPNLSRLRVHLVRYHFLAVCFHCCRNFSTETPRQRDHTDSQHAKAADQSRKQHECRPLQTLPGNIQSYDAQTVNTRRWRWGYAEANNGASGDDIDPYSEMSLIRTAPSQRRGQSQSPSRRGSIQQTPTRGTSSIPVSHGVQNTTPTAGTRPPTFASATLHGEGSIYAGVSLPSQSTMESRSQTHTTSQGVPSSFNLDLTPSSGLSADRNVISLTPATSIDHSTDFYTERGSLLRKIADLQALNRSLEDSRSALQTENSECMRRYSNEVNVSTLLQNVIRDRDAQIEQLTAQLQRANDRLAFLDHQQQDPNLFGN